MKTHLSTVEKQFAAECIAENKRLDGRIREEAREAQISLGPKWGFAEVLFGKTQAVASTFVEAITPSPDRGDEGSITISLSLSATSSQAAVRATLQRVSGPSSVEMRNTIEGFVRDSRAIDTEALCILAGVKVWSVRVEVDVINDDGNVMDVAMMAVMASLMHARRSDVTVSGKEVRIHPTDEREPVPLPVHHVPLSVTFALFGMGKPYEPGTVVLDPVKKEEIASNGSLSFSCNSQGEVCGVYKAGGLPLQRESFVECSRIAEKHVTQLTGTLKTALAAASAEHPLSTVRPMLVEREPVAMLEKREEDEMVDAPMSTWNATPAVDDAPPTMEMGNGYAGKGNAEEVVQTIFEKPARKEVNRDEEMADSRVGEKVEVSKKKESSDKVEISKKALLDELMESDSDSSGDDLADAVISRPRGGSGRARRR